MTAAFVLWGHALAALAFGILALGQARRRGGEDPQPALIVALSATGLWALTVAGLDARDVTGPVMVAIRDLSWLFLMGMVVRGHASAGIALASVYAMAIGMTIASLALALVATAPFDAAGLVALADARFALRMMGAATGLVLVNHMVGAASPPSRWLVRAAVMVLGVLWSFDLIVSTIGYIGGRVPVVMTAVRGFVLAGAAVLSGLVVKHQVERDLKVSRSTAMRALAALALVAYVGGTVLLTAVAEHTAGSYGRTIQTAIVLGSATALMTLLSTPWLRAWTRVKLSKHLFRHRYDYRAEWQRFTATLGVPGPDADPLERRIIKAVADLTDSPAGLLLATHAHGLEAVAGWRWDGGGKGGEALAAYLQSTARIVEIDAVRNGQAQLGDGAVVPPWMIDRGDAWVLVPLIHHSDLAGAILLARPPIDRSLDWEDLDLLRVAGRQAASYLAEHRAHSALADVERFDEFNRRFAFILHDIKNLVSGLTLVARNAERHADNPAFRADMIATLQDSAGRMNQLLAKLSQHHQPSAEASQPVDVSALAARIAMARRAQHRIVTTGAGWAVAQPGRLTQLIDQLVQNAVEASDADAAVTLLVRTDGARTEIHIVDRGCGMSAAFVREQLFRPFASSKSGGFGLGAYEARQLAETMGGVLSVESEPGVGTRFTLSLPAATAMEAAA